MIKTLSALRALASTILLGVGLSTYAGHLDPVTQHVVTPTSTQSRYSDLANAGIAPCIIPSLEEQSQGNGAEGGRENG